MFILRWGMGERTLIFSSKNRETENHTVIVISDLRKYFILTFNLTPYLFYNIQSAFVYMISSNNKTMRKVSLVSFSDEGTSEFSLSHIILKTCVTPGSVLGAETYRDSGDCPFCSTRSQHPWCRALGSGWRVSLGDARIMKGLGMLLPEKRLRALRLFSLEPTVT